MLLNFGGTEEKVITRGEEGFTLEGALSTLNRKTISVIGYGSQGPAQAQNLKDQLKGQEVSVIVGQREGGTYNDALADGWVPGETLFSPEEAAKRGNIIALLVSDAGAPEVWEKIRQHVDGKTLYISHGFPVHFSGLTGIVPSSATDVIMVAPKGAGLSVRGNFLDGSGINASYAVHQDASGHALETLLAMAMGIGAGYLFPTTCEKEVVSDHFGERNALLAHVWALAEASYESLARAGLSREQTFIHTSEQLTQVILPSIGRSGAAEIYFQAMRAGELGKVLKYQDAVRESTASLMGSLYESCASGIEARIALEKNSQPGYRDGLNAELDAIDKSEMWTTGKQVRRMINDRTYGGKITNFALAGAVLGMIEAQYQLLINKGHSPSEAWNESCEELTQSLNQFYQAKGISHLLGVCSTTAKRGALDWGPKFKEIVLPILMAEYSRQYSGPGSVPVNYTATTPNIWDVALTGRLLRPENLQR